MTATQNDETEQVTVSMTIRTPIPDVPDLQITIPVVATLQPVAWRVFDPTDGRDLGRVTEMVGYYLAHWAPYGDEDDSRHATRDEAVAAVIAGGA